MICGGKTIPAQTTKGPARQRQAGRRQVLSVIRQSGQIARIDIAAHTGGSPATVTAITAELLEEGLIEEHIPTRPATSSRGRPRVALKIRGAAHIIAGIKVAAHAATVCFLDFEGKSCGAFENPLPKAALKAEEMVAFLRSTLEKACAATGHRLQDLSAFGLGVAGIVDARRGLVYWSPILAERNVELAAMLASALPMPIFIDNDANLVAKAEHLFGLGRGLDDFIVITVEQGVGMGIVLGGKIYRGNRGCGTEFGHTKVQLDGALCRCGQRGCLEAYVADYALLREAGILGPVPDSTPPADQLNALFHAADCGDETARSIFQRASRMFALGLANVINVFDPALIILSGERMQFDYFYAPEMMEAVRSNILQIDAPLPQIQVHEWGDLMWAKGAAAFAMEGISDIAVREMGKNAH